MIRAVLFDAHGTLVELEPPAPALRAILADRFGVEIAPEDARRALAAEIAFYRSHMDGGRDPASVAHLRARCAEVIRAELGGLDGIDGAAITDALLGALVFRPFDDALPALRTLRGAGLALVVASNWDASLEGTLGELGLRAELDGVVSSGACGAAKPDPAIFAQALLLAGAAAAETIHVGDSLEEDVRGARGAGIEPVMLLRDGAGPAPPGVRTIRSLAALPALVGCA